MHASPHMQQIIEAIAAKHGVGLTRTGAWLRLEMPNMDRLVIEAIGSDRVSVAHYFEANGDLVADPEIVFHVAASGWYAIEITQVLTGWRQLAKKDTTVAWLVNRARQADAASFANVWGRNIAEQGWLTDGTLTRVERGA